MRWFILLLIFLAIVYAIDRAEEALGLRKLNSTVEDSIKAIEYINELRAKEGLKPIKWDERAFKLALYRAKDMVEKGYFSHISPSGERAESLKIKFGFPKNEDLCENIYMEAYNKDPFNPKFMDYYDGIEKVAINDWMNSPPHRHNLLHPHLKGGAVACYKACCVFIGY